MANNAAWPACLFPGLARAAGFPLLSTGHVFASSIELGSRVCLFDRVVCVFVTGFTKVTKSSIYSFSGLAKNTFTCCENIVSCHCFFSSYTGKLLLPQQYFCNNVFSGLARPLDTRKLLSKFNLLLFM